MVLTLFITTGANLLLVGQIYVQLILQSLGNGFMGIAFLQLYLFKFNDTTTRA